MAVSSLLPRKASGGRTRRQVLESRLGYDRKGEKTKDGELVSSYMCSPESAAWEFETSKSITMWSLTAPIWSANFGYSALR